MGLSEIERQNWLTKIKATPQDIQLWIGMAQVAQNADDFKLAFQGYLSALSLQPQNTMIAESYFQLRSKFQQTIPIDTFSFDLFRLPNKTAVMLLVGTTDMIGLPELEQGAVAYLRQGFHWLICDCSGIHTLSGLGPSTFRCIQQKSQKLQGKFLLFQPPKHLHDMLELKRIVIPEYQDFSSIFAACTLK